MDIPPGKSSNGTESRANEHFYWPPNSPKRLFLVRPGCNVIVCRRNFARGLWPHGWNRRSMTGSNAAQHWRHSKNRRHFRFGPRSQSGPSHRGQLEGENAHATIIRLHR